MWTAIKCAYLGWRFHGSQTQPGEETVERALSESLSHLGYQEMVRLASRTDRGVSALGNVFVIPADERRFRAINARLTDVVCHSYASVPEGFRPRYASGRWYRYVLPAGRVEDPGAFARAIRLFAGEHDFSGFTRERERDAHLRIDSIEVSERAGSIVVDVRAERFLMHMIRFIMAGALTASSSGDMGEIENCLRSGKRPFNLAPEDPHGLILMDVEYDGVEFAHVKLGSRSIKNWVHRSQVRALSECEVFEALDVMLKGSS
jgi:tRNA pseudouridine38-40 synthase